MPREVSIVIPMKDAASFITATLDTLRIQEAIPVEIIVVNDGSTDRSAALVNASPDHRIRLIDGPQQGIAAAVNAGVAAAGGDIIMRCDADDFFTPGRVARQATWLAANPEFSAVCGNFATMDEQGNLIRQMDCGDAAAEITGELQRGVTRTHLGTFAIRSDAWRAIGGCRPYFYSGEDIDLQLRLGEHGRVFYLPEHFYTYRLHDESRCHSMSTRRRLFFDETARSFQAERRRRKSDALQDGRPPTPPGEGGAVWPARSHQQGLLLGLAWQEHAAGERGRAISIGWRAVRAKPDEWAAWRSVVALVFKRPGRP